MKTKLEAIANITVILVALAVGGVILRQKIAAPRIPRSVAAGDRLSPVPGIDWSTHRRTLILALNSSCHYCQDSMPFYQGLVQGQPKDRQDLDIIAVFPNDAEAVQQLLRQEALSIRGIPAVPLDQLGVVGTPTLILVDGEGRVQQSWVGLLTPRQQLEVLTAVSASAQDCSASESSSMDLNKKCSSGTKDQVKN